MSKWLVVLSLVFGVSTTAHANLILNGSFESPRALLIPENKRLINKKHKPTDDHRK